MANPLTSFARMFSGDKTVPSPLLNRMGIQVMRTMIARGMYKFRSLPVDSDLQSAARELLSDGLVVLPEFLPDAEFAAVQSESRQLSADAELKHKTLHHGPNQLELTTFDTSRDFAKYPAIGRFYQDRRLVQLMQCAEKRKLDYTIGNHAYEHLVQGPLGEEKDPETDMHSDIFFHTHKAWLYLEDVAEEHGPLVAVKRSHLLTPKSLAYLYQESTSNNKGSRRITPEELTALGLTETVLTVPKNTLVIANVHGYHCRRRGQPGKERFALHWSLRANPFRLTSR
ncbi:MAG: phytanoyl-CoA dioxygenase family protein [Pirellulales bacterium]|nr:phytanoyl-CoA dioxygenase family protein [Pirellulales bacterium]